MVNFLIKFLQKSIRFDVFFAYKSRLYLVIDKWVVLSDFYQGAFNIKTGHVFAKSGFSRKQKDLVMFIMPIVG